jgi:hypothetical protein
VICAQLCVTFRMAAGIAGREKTIQPTIWLIPIAALSIFRRQRRSTLFAAEKKKKGGQRSMNSSGKNYSRHTTALAALAALRRLIRARARHITCGLSDDY